MKTEKITQTDVVKGWAKYYAAAEVSSGFERLTAPAFSYGMGDILEKLYKGNDEEYRKAMQRHLLFYNSESTFGSIIFGITAALEEERADLMNKGATEDQLDASAEMISSLKIGLMGPLAGLGDTVAHAMIRPLLLSAFIPLAAGGAWIAGVAPLVIWGLSITAFAYFLTTTGYKSGQKSVTQLLKSGKLNEFIQVVTVLGLFMMGALSSTYVKLATKVSWTSALGEEMFLQSYLDNIFPKILPLMAVFGIYFFFKKKGPRYVTILLTIIVLSLVFSFLGIV